MEWLQQNEGHIPEFFVHLRPTTPLRDVKLMDEAIAKFVVSKEYSSMRSAHPAPESPYKWFRLDGQSHFSSLISELSNEDINGDRKSFPEAYIPDGYEIDSVECDELFQEKTWIYIGPDNENLIISQLPDYVNIYIDNERSESEAFALGNLEGVLYDFRDELVCVIQYESTVITISGPVDRDELIQIIRGMNIPE